MEMVFLGLFHREEGREPGRERFQAFIGGQQKDKEPRITKEFGKSNAHVNPQSPRHRLVHVCRLPSYVSLWVPTLMEPRHPLSHLGVHFTESHHHRCAQSRAPAVGQLLCRAGLTGEQVRDPGNNKL